MSEAVDTEAGPVAAPSAGRLLREARERQGLHIAVLAASIKVTQKKLELLEADRFDALPDATFTRALAQTVCRALKIDSAAVLHLLPPPAGHRLEQVGEGLNAPFRERPGVLVQRDGAGFSLGWVFWLTAVILIAAAAVDFLPAGWQRLLAGRNEATAARAPASAATGQPASTLPPTPASTLAAPPAAAAVPGAEPPAASASSAVEGMVEVPGSHESDGTEDAAATAHGAIRLSTSAPSWVEITDASGRALIARLVAADETLALDGVAPFRVRVGNAAATRLLYRGQPVALVAARDNTATAELK
jgi:cytoskeleton protein RodZ